MPTVIINDQEIELPEGQSVNGIEAARMVGIEIPHYCWHPGLSVVASCRMCLVETGRKDPESGDVSMLPKLVPACQTPATDGTVFITESEKVKQARAMVEEDLLIRHPIDCPICDKAGECSLQDYHFQHGQVERRADIKPFTSRRRSLGNTVTLFVDRCVMCTRCVRFTREISGSKELMIINRGSHEEIDVFPGYELNDPMSGNVVDLCPVGALGDKDFLYNQRVWFMKGHASVCTGCSTGCSIDVEENQDRIYRLKPRENPHINQWWMCDEGRYGYRHVHDPGRLITPGRRSDEGTDETMEWSSLLTELTTKLTTVRRMAVVLSPHLTCEEAHLLSRLAQRVDEKALIAVGPIPTRGEDQEFASGFVIRAEKCPNRRGVERIAARMNGSLLAWNDLMPRLADEPIDAIWVTGGYKTDWVDESTADKIAALVPMLIVQDLFSSALWEKAHWKLPGASFAERAGSYVNFDDRLQAFDWSIRPPAGAMVEAQVYWQLLGLPGLYQPRAALDELARDIAYFAAAAHTIPATGLDLKVDQLATN
jgi:NADH-quinone oxidoreductase subunit G